ncbi:MAG: hypothetical protein A3K19_19705 [Lentisphaerae bacterium RIFOXYB12_FULL_65_16]|nr:MAG: hypothetical protein A3K18_31110 [Lentisphaerae bacterium RIFOXYA12_64_32]OGV92088.1 MAG: hypothetical protein A3K19_19705 [Lentisphaerae bacterium RIFOXYB12_FULL_65_16]
MTASTVIEALALPREAYVDQRVPKTLLVENGAPTAGDKRQINEGIEEVRWLAALKPTTIGVPTYCDVTREYLEIAVLRLVLRPKARGNRLVELVHRAIPYPVLLISGDDGTVSLSAVHKRWAQNEAGKTVLDGEVIAVEWNESADARHWPAFLDALALLRQPRTTLHALYQGWIDTMTALHTARLTGTFVAGRTGEHAAQCRADLREIARLDAEIVRLRAAAGREKQIPRQVELNLELKRVEAARNAARARL